MSNVTSISNSSTLIGIDPPPTVRAPEIEEGERTRHYARVALDRMLSLR